jgi:hypothetical protein
MAKRWRACKGHEITVDGPAVIRFQKGRATVLIDAKPLVKIECGKRKARKNPLVR